MDYEQTNPLPRSPSAPDIILALVTAQTLPASFSQQLDSLHKALTAGGTQFYLSTYRVCFTHTVTLFYSENKTKRETNKQTNNFSLVTVVKRWAQSKSSDDD